ncbi:ATP-binding protein, partial [Staphylococcus pasteuri]
MEHLNLISTAGLQVMLLFWVAKIILNIKFKFWDYIIIIGIIIPSIIMYYFFNKTGLIFIFIAMFIFYYYKVKLYSFIITLISNLVMYLSNFLSVSLYLTLASIFNDSYLLFTIHLITFYSIALLLA